MSMSEIVMDSGSANTVQAGQPQTRRQVPAASAVDAGGSLASHLPQEFLLLDGRQESLVEWYQM